MNIGRIIGYAVDGAIYCGACFREEPAFYSACDAEGAEFDGGSGWHNCGAVGADRSPCHVVTAGEDPYPITSGDIQDREACGGCRGYWDSAWGGWLQPDSDPDADPDPDPFEGRRPPHHATPLARAQVARVAAVTAADTAAADILGLPPAALAQAREIRAEIRHARGRLRKLSPIGAAQARGVAALMAAALDRGPAPHPKLAETLAGRLPAADRAATRVSAGGCYLVTCLGCLDAARACPLHAPAEAL